MRRQISACLLLTFIPYLTEAEGRCLGPDAGEYQEGGLSFGYDSWVDEPETSYGMYEFGRCIEARTRQYFYASWEPAGLSGLVEYGFPLRVVYRFPLADSVPLPGELAFGPTAAELSSKLDAYFIANTRENQDHPELAVILSAISAEPELPEGFKDFEAIESEATVNFPIADTQYVVPVTFRVVASFPKTSGELLRGSTLTIFAEFPSDYEVGENSEILQGLNIEAEFAPLVSEGVVVSSPLGPINLNEAFFEEGVVVSNTDFMTRDNLSLAVTKVTVRLEGLEVATFPITQYVDGSLLAQ